MSKTNLFETQALQHFFNNTTLNSGGTFTLPGATTAGSFYVALFTADPGEGDSLTNEADYTGYARVAVARNSGAWTVSGNQVTNASAITFGQCTGGSNTITHFGITINMSGTAIIGPFTLLYYGVLDTPEAVSTGVTPTFAAGSLIITED